jgi:hypothetical protein
MPNPRTWWPQPLYAGSRAGPDEVTLRPCGCRIDPVVFGHYCTVPVDAP